MPDKKICAYCKRPLRLDEYDICDECWWDDEDDDDDDDAPMYEYCQRIKSLCQNDICDECWWDDEENDNAWHDDAWLEFEDD